jgi:hypothetical protein
VRYRLTTILPLPCQRGEGRGEGAFFAPLVHGEEAFCEPISIATL